MESTFLSIKFVIFVGLMAVVVATVGLIVIAGVYQLIRDRVRKPRLAQPVPQESTSRS